MSRSELVQCPVCGWTGNASELERSGETASCPTCAEEIPSAE